VLESSEACSPKGPKRETNKNTSTSGSHVKEQHKRYKNYNYLWFEFVHVGDLMHPRISYYQNLGNYYLVPALS
jgi:hypothetical protein